MKLIHIPNRGQYYNSELVLSLTKLMGEKFMLRFIHTPTHYVIENTSALNLIVWLVKDDLSPTDRIFKVECVKHFN